MPLELDHIQIAIPADSEDVARAFWSGKIGLSEIPKPLALRPRGGCWFQLGQHELHLGVENPFTPSKKAHPGFLTSDLQGLAEKLDDVLWDTAIEGRARFFTTDPFGNRLEFIQA